MTEYMNMEITDLTFSEHDPYCYCKGVGGYADDDRQYACSCGPTAILRASGPEGLEEGLRELLLPNWCESCTQMQDDYHFGVHPPEDGIYTVEITTRVLVLDGKDGKIDFGASDLRCEECNTVGAAVTCSVCRLRKAPRGRSVPLEMCNSLCDFECPGYETDHNPGHLWPEENQRDFGYPACPCRRYPLDGVDKVVLEDNLDPCSCDDDYPCAACDRSCNLAAARESLAEQVEVVG